MEVTSIFLRRVFPAIFSSGEKFKERGPWVIPRFHFVSMMAIYVEIIKTKIIKKMVRQLIPAGSIISTKIGLSKTLLKYFSSTYT